jgi:exodeoxyribonuclease VII large subunit
MAKLVRASEKKLPPPPVPAMEPPQPLPLTPSLPPKPTEIKYTPSSIINIFNNLIVAPEEKKIIIIKGIYFQKLGKKSYNGHWYDELQDESSDNTITLKVSDLFRNRLTSNTTIEIRGFITKQIDNKGSISILVNPIELIEQTSNKYSEEDVKKIEIINKKISLGFKDLDSHIKQYIYNNQKPSIKILQGHSAIIDQDIKTQMAEAIALYEIEFIPTTISSIPDIITTLKRLNLNSNDIVAISRGGGDIDLKIFDKPELCELWISLPSFLISAIGHKADTPLIEQVSDKKFSTPTAFGQYLKELYNSTVEDFEQSKAKIVSDVTQQLKANYDKQVSVLNQQIVSLKELHTKTLTEKEAVLTKQIETLQIQIKAEKELFKKSQEEAAKNQAEQIIVLNSKIKAFEELMAKTIEERNKVYIAESSALKAQIEQLNQAYLKQKEEAENTQRERVSQLSAQIKMLQDQQVRTEAQLKDAQEEARLARQRAAQAPTGKGGCMSVVLGVAGFGMLLIVIFTMVF